MLQYNFKNLREHMLMTISLNCSGLAVIDEEDLQTRVTKLVEFYADDLDKNLFWELKQCIAIKSIDVAFVLEILVG